LKAQLAVTAIAYITSEDQANQELQTIQHGTVGLDTEFVKRILDGEERLIDEIPTMPPAFKKAARTALQYLQSLRENFEPDWEKAGLCLVQIAHENKVWVLNLTRMKGKSATYLPTDLEHL